MIYERDGGSFSCTCHDIFNPFVDVEFHNFPCCILMFSRVVTGECYHFSADAKVSISSHFIDNVAWNVTLKTSTRNPSVVLVGKITFLSFSAT